jgi:hypothetical protein
MNSSRTGETVSCIGAAHVHGRVDEGGRAHEIHSADPTCPMGMQVICRDAPSHGPAHQDCAIDIQTLDHPVQIIGPRQVVRIGGNFRWLVGFPMATKIERDESELLESFAGSAHGGKYGVAGVLTKEQLDRQ